MSPSSSSACESPTNLDPTASWDRRIQVVPATRTRWRRRRRRRGDHDGGQRWLTTGDVDHFRIGGGGGGGGGPSQAPPKKAFNN